MPLTWAGGMLPTLPLGVCPLARCCPHSAKHVNNYHLNGLRPVYSHHHFTGRETEAQEGRNLPRTAFERWRWSGRERGEQYALRPMPHGAAGRSLASGANLRFSRRFLVLGKSERQSLSWSLAGPIGFLGRLGGWRLWDAMAGTSFQTQRESNPCVVQRVKPWTLRSEVQRSIPSITYARLTCLVLSLFH